MDYDRSQLRKELSRDEGREAVLYLDKKGILTGGVGWNFEANSVPAAVKALLPDDWVPQLGATLSEAAVDALLDIGIAGAESVLGAYVPRWPDFDPVRQRALLNMAFNLGHRLAKFPRFLACVRAGDWDGAMQELDRTHSPQWHTDVGPRADRVMAMVGTGESIVGVA